MKFPLFLAACLVALAPAAAFAQRKEARPAAATRAAAPLSPAVDAEYGFLGVPLGSPMERFSQMETIEEVGRWHSYKDPREKVRWEGCQLDEIRYNFLWGKLYSIHIDVRGRGNVRGLLRVMEARYGPNFSRDTQSLIKAGDVIETREWTGRRAFLLYKSATSGTGGQIVVVDRPTWEKMQQPREQMVRESLEWMGGSYLKGEFELKEKVRPGSGGER